MPFERMHITAAQRAADHSNEHFARAELRQWILEHPERPGGPAENHRACYAAYQETRPLKKPGFFEKTGFLPAQGQRKRTDKTSQHFSQMACLSRIRENLGPLISKGPNNNEFGYGLLQLAKVLQNSQFQDSYRRITSARPAATVQRMASKRNTAGYPY